VKAAVFMITRLKQLAANPVNKTRLLMISNSGWGDRKKINELVSVAFNGTVQNLYRNKNSVGNTDPSSGGDGGHPVNGRGGGQGSGKNHQTTAEHHDHYRLTAESKFVLAPSGLGFDSYRLWETLILGSIPIVESNTGFDRTYSSLPVLVVRNYSDVNPGLLNKAYPCFVKHAADFHYQHLTQRYWMELLRRAIVTGTVDHITREHPQRNRYCDFLS
jgi:hypothetical protein